MGSKSISGGFSFSTTLNSSHDHLAVAFCLIVYRYINSLYRSILLIHPVETIERERERERGPICVERKEPTRTGCTTRVWVRRLCCCVLEQGLWCAWFSIFYRIPILFDWIKRRVNRYTNDEKATNGKSNPSQGGSSRRSIIILNVFDFWNVLVLTNTSTTVSILIFIIHISIYVL